METRFNTCMQAAITVAVFVFVVLFAAAPGAHAAAAPAKEPDVIRYPRAGASIEKKKPVIGANFQNELKKSKGLKPRLFVDGTDVTSVCEIGKGYIFFTPAENLAIGRHDVSVTLEEQGGRQKPAVTWSFTVSGDEPPMVAYPQPDSSVDSKRPTIGIDLKDLPSDLDRKSVRLLVDGKDVTAKSDVTEEYVFYTPENELTPGKHRVQIMADRISGGGRSGRSWSFKVKGEEIAAAAEKTEKKPAGEKKPAAAADDKGAAKRKDRTASAVATTKRTDNTISKGAGVSEKLYGPSPEAAGQQKVIVVHQTTQPQAGATAEVTTQTLAGAEASAQQQQVAETPQGPAYEGFEYALETTYGFENVAVGGNTDLSSQRARNAYVYRLGLRTQTTLNTLFKPGIMKQPMFSMNMKMEGTSDGDETESFWDLKKLTFTLADEKKNVTFYDIQPKYTSYTLTGQWLLGGEATITGTKSKTHFFSGVFKKPRAGRNVSLTGFRYALDKDESSKMSVQFVTADIEEVRTLAKTQNSVLSMTYEKKGKANESKFEYAMSRYSELGNDRAYRFENIYKRKKTLVTSSYENVGNFFRSESGFASYGLVEFRTSAQRQLSKRATTVLGFWRRTFREGGSHTVTYPFMFRYLPIANKPSTIFEYRFKMVYYDKGAAWKDTLTNTYDLSHKLGKHSLTFSFKDEQIQRNSSSDEEEHLFNFTSSSPVTKKTTLSYKLSKLNNNLYGSETKGYYGVSYELSDWSDVRLSFESVSKEQATLNRDTTRLRFGKVNPDTNSEISVEMYQNKFLLYDETSLSMKYSLFY